MSEWVNTWQGDVEGSLVEVISRGKDAEPRFGPLSLTWWINHDYVFELFVNSKKVDSYEVSKMSFSGKVELRGNVGSVPIRARIEVTKDGVASAMPWARDKRIPLNLV